MIKKRLEEESYSGIIFWITVALLIVTAWAIYDEVEVRRPWKGYQRTFHEALESRIDSLVVEAESTLQAPEVREERQAITERLETARAALRSPEIEEALAQKQREEIALSDMRQEYTFRKSEYEEAYYFYKLAQKEGRDPSLHRRKLDELQVTLSDLETEIEHRSQSLEAQNSAVNAYVDTVAALEERLQAMTRTLESLRAMRKELDYRPLEIRQVVLDKLGTVDRCQSCHVAIDRQEFDRPEDKEPLRAHPKMSRLLGNHPVEEFGCTTCHEGQGAQTKGIGHRPFDHGRDDPYWDRPMLKWPFVESSCHKCHVEEWEIDHADNLNLGRRLFEELGCVGCHAVDGITSRRKLGPDLTSLKGKTSPGWLVEWIANPKSLRPRTRMPNFWPQALDSNGVDITDSPETTRRDDEVLAIAAYLWTNSSAGIAHYPDDVIGDEAHGEQLFRTVGCVGCHRPAAMGLPPLSIGRIDRDFAPDLSYVGGKSNYDWLFAWILDPKSHWPDTKMPNLRLTTQEAADIAAYLMTLQREGEFAAPSAFGVADDEALAELAVEGGGLITDYECYGCHNIKGFENLRPALELNGFASKATVRLAFGDAITDHTKQNWYSWTELKLRQPRAFETERARLRMPDFSLSDEEVTALMVFLRGLGEDDVPLSYKRKLEEKDKSLAVGERLISFYNCRGCHRIGDSGGEISKLIPEAALNPPDLTLEGRKVQPAWLFDFLRNPVSLRPWLALRMPTFGLEGDAANEIIRYLMALADENELFVENPPTPSVESITAGAGMFEKFKCVQCHQLTTDQAVSLSDLAPDLGLARSRLRPQWVADWLIDPQKLQPETKMPTFFPLEDDDDPESVTTPLPDVLDGEVHKQIAAIRDYLFSLEQ